MSDEWRRSYLGISRATLVEADDKPMMQEATIRTWWGDKLSNVESWQGYGVTAHPKKPEPGKEPEALVAFLGGSPDHPVVIATADRRYRPKDLKEGEVALHDDQGQGVHLGRDGVTVTGKGKLTLSTGGEGKIVIEGDKVTLYGEIHLGGDGGQKVHRKGDTDSDGDTAVGSASKVYAV